MKREGGWFCWRSEEGACSFGSIDCGEGDVGCGDADSSSDGASAEDDVSVVFVFVHHGVLGGDDSQGGLFAALFDFPREDDFVEDEVGLVEVEYEVELADVSKVPVKHFDVVVDDFEGEEFVVALVNAGNKVQAGVSFDDEGMTFPVDEVAKLSLSVDDHLGDFFDESFAVRLLVGGVPLFQSGLALSADEKEESEHFGQQLLGCIAYM